MPPTIRSLAKIAQVSTATVSMALRNHPRISQRERDRIQGIAAEAGYQSNALVGNLLAQLRLGKSSTYQSTLGLLAIGHGATDLRTVPTFRDWVAGCEARAFSLGYKLDQFSLREVGMSPQRLRQILNTRNIRGLLIIGPFENNPLLEGMAEVWENSASIVMGIRPGHPALAFVSNDQFYTTSEAVRELNRLGYRRPGLCLAPALDDSVENRFSGGFAVTQNTLPAEDRVPVFNYQPDAPAAFIGWLRTQRPDVILTLHPQIESWVEHAGLRVPDDLGLVHLDRRFEEEKWAGMQQNNDHIGRAAVDMLIGQLHRNEFGVPPFQKGMLIASSWCPGATVCKRQASGPKNFQLTAKPIEG